MTLQHSVRTVTKPNEFAPASPEYPDFFIDGVPYKSSATGVDANGRTIYEDVALIIDSTTPSSVWREGC